MHCSCVCRRGLCLLLLLFNCELLLLLTGSAFSNGLHFVLLGRQGLLDLHRALLLLLLLLLLLRLGPGARDGLLLLLLSLLFAVVVIGVGVGVDCTGVGVGVGSALLLLLLLLLGLQGQLLWVGLGLCEDLEERVRFDFQVSEPGVLVDAETASDEVLALVRDLYVARERDGDLEDLVSEFLLSGGLPGRLSTE